MTKLTALEKALPPIAPFRDNSISLSRYHLNQSAFHMPRKNSPVIPEERIMKRIVILRDDKVILDLHLAELYGVETRALKQAVRRNSDRFPDDFMFELTDEEMKHVVSQNVIPSKRHFGGARPFAFTELGVAMLSSVLNSSKAVEMNMVIMRTFVALRRTATNYSELLLKIEEIERKMTSHDHSILVLFEHLKRLLDEKRTKEKYASRKRIGFTNDQE